MGILTLLCFAVATILAALAAFWTPPSPPPVNLLAASIFFIALALTLQAWSGMGG